MNGWQPIESAPKDGRELLLWCPSAWCDGASYIGAFRMDANAREGDGPGWFKDDYDDYSTGYASTPLEPTHWLPIPPSPNEPRYTITPAGRATLEGKG